MDVLVSTIKNSVRIVIDEIALNDASFLSEKDESELDSIIEGRLCEAVDFVHLSANRELLAGDETKQESHVEDLKDVTDMLRFLWGTRGSWNKTVSEVVYEGTEEYNIIMDEYVGASVDRPAAVVEFDGVGRDLRLLPENGSDDGMFFYIKKSAITGTGDSKKIAIDKLMLDAVVNYLAGLVLMTLNDDRGENLIKLATSRMGVGIDN